MSGNQLRENWGRRTGDSRTFACLVGAVVGALAICTSASAAKLEVLHEFTGPDGSDPQGGLTIDPNTGTLYGTAIYGGNGYGTVFSLTPQQGPAKQKWKYEVIYAFKGDLDGSYPSTGMAISPSGDFLWGTTLRGSALGACGCGTIFRLENTIRHGWVKKKVHDFSGELFDGILPNSAPVIDRQTAYLYGTTSSSTSSTIYRMLLGDNSFTVIYNAEHQTGEYVGYHPQGVAVDANGTLYGTAFDGEFAGTIFRIGPDGDGEILHRFGGSDGLYPLGPPVLSPGGALYGTTWEGGKPGDCPESPGCGTVWKKLPSSKEKLLHSFAFFTHHRDGLTPLSPLVLDSLTGTLYGTTYNGGTGTVCGGNFGSCGTVYSVDSAGGHYQVLWEFPKGGPAAPQGQLVFHNGALYGTSYDGGKQCPDGHYIGCGTVWKLTP